MKLHFVLPRLLVGLAAIFGAGARLHADIEVRLSVKFILNSDGTRPSAAAGPISISNVVDFAAEVDWGNEVLAATGRGYRLRVVEYLDIRPPAPSGQASGYWFNLDARTNRQVFESAALADTITWRWNSGALNIFVNNSSSGSCSFIGDGTSISLGATIFTQGTVVHEVGHFFNLRHTHANDVTCATTPPPYMASDGDGLAATINDHNCLNTIDALSMANFGGRVFSALTANEQAQVNSSWLNVMSYHQEEQLLDDQMDLWTFNANVFRLFVCSGRTWFVSNLGLDTWPGNGVSQPFNTIPRALSAVGTANDVILLRTGGYTVPGSINTACTLSATRGPVTITRQ